MLFLFLLFFLLKSSAEDGFTFNGFLGTNLSLDGLSSITSDGLLQLTNTTTQMKAHAFHPTPLHFKSPSGRVVSFSTTFVFGMIPKYPDLNGQGFTFLIAPTTNYNLSTPLPAQFMGLFNSNSNGNPTNHIFAIELDTVQNVELQDINKNHVGIDLNSLESINSHAAGYYSSYTGLFNNLKLDSGRPMQVWIDFDGEDMRLNVTLSPAQMAKPSKPLLSSTVNLSGIMVDPMYIGFSSSTGPFMASHIILGWSFKKNGQAESLDYSKLPRLPHAKGSWKKDVAVFLPLALTFLVLVVVVVVVFIARRKIKYAELLEDWELVYGPHRFSYKDLYHATKGFKEEELLGAGGFGRVYRGVLPKSNIEVAVKRVSHGSRQGMKEFVAEIVSIGHLRHRNMVQLLGYCRRKEELLLVYDFMPKGSLDKFLYDRTKPGLDWAHRFRIVKGVASGLLYLHQDWEKVVIHRDIKASNVLLDNELNGRLGDFGLARLYDHGTDPQTTHVVGTRGYLAPELIRTGKATTATDLFAFGIFLLESVCGRRPVEPNGQGEELLLVGWVLENWKRGSLLATRDPRLGDDYSVEEMEMVLKLGLLCSHPMPTARPSMRQVVQFLEGDTTLHDLPTVYMSFTSMSFIQGVGLHDHSRSVTSNATTISTLSGGR